MTRKLSLFGLLTIALFAAAGFLLQVTGMPPRTMETRLEPYGNI